ncbi:MAG: hypothetical protein MHM6MM_000778 [Cercozoa sp. M6MM]
MPGDRSRRDRRRTSFAKRFSFRRDGSQLTRSPLRLSLRFLGEPFQQLQRKGAIDVISLLQQENAPEAFNEAAAELSPNDLQSCCSTLFQTVRQYRQLLDMAVDLNSDVREDAVLPSLQKIAHSLIPCRGVVIWLVDGDDLVAVTSDMSGIAVDQRHAVAERASVAASCARTGRSLHVDNNGHSLLTADSDGDSDGDAADRSDIESSTSRTRSGSHDEVLSDRRHVDADSVLAPWDCAVAATLATPVFAHDGTVVGVMQLFDREAEDGMWTRFDAEDLRSLCFIASLGGLSLQNARFCSQTLRQKSRLAALLDWTRAMCRQKDLTHVVQRIISAGYELVDAKRISLSFVDVARSELTVRISLDAIGVKVPLGASLAGACATSQETIYVPDVYADSRFCKDVDEVTDFHTSNMLALPVLVKDDESESDGMKCVAVMQACNGTFDKEAREVLEQLALSAAAVFRQAEQQQKLIEEQRKVRSLLTVSRAAALDATAPSPTRLFGKVTSAVRHALDADIAVLFLSDHKHELLAVETQHAPEESTSQSSGSSLLLHRMVTIRDEAASQEELHEWATQTIMSARQSAGPAHARTFAEHSVLCVPVFEEEKEPFAVLAVARTRPMRRSEVDLCESMCLEMSHAMRRLVLTALLERTTGDAATSSLLETYNDDEPPSPRKSRHKRQAAFVFPASASSPPSPPLAASDDGDIGGVVVGSLDRWQDMQVWQHSDEQLVQLAVAMFVDMGFVSDLRGRPVTFGTLEQLHVLATEVPETDIDDEGHLKPPRVPAAVLSKWLRGVARTYHESNPFHNFQHAWSVLHMVWWMLRHTGAASLLSPLDVWATLLSAILHDVDHPGVSNGFEIMTESERALLYNDTSVLEHHHARLAWQLLTGHVPAAQSVDKDQHVYCVDLVAQAGLSPQARRTLRKRVTRAILATDMAHHFDLVRQADPFDWKRHGVAVGDDGVVRYADDVSENDVEPLDRQWLCGMLVHVGDLSGQVYPQSTATRWEGRITGEFLAQVQREQQLGVPTAPFMQGLDDMPTRCRLQANFMDFVLTPLWRSVARLLPVMKPALDNLVDNACLFRRCGENDDEALQQLAVLPVPPASVS